MERERIATTFRDRAEADAAGWWSIASTRRAMRTRTVEVKRQVGLDMWTTESVPIVDVADVSGPNAYGYSYALRRYDGAVLAEASCIWLTEGTNQIGRTGAWPMMFRREDVDAALSEAA